jgi:hypothetical protein
VVSALPGLGTAMSVQTREKTYDELLIVIQPTLTSGRGAHGVYLSLPTNNPK